MKINKLIENTIVAFHIGRGGKLNNLGHLSFVGNFTIDYFTNDLYMRHEHLSKYCDRVGYSKSYDWYPSILGLIENNNYEKLKSLYGIAHADLGTNIFYTKAGKAIDLTEEDVASGIGRINIDGQYDTTYTKYLHDCDDSEINAILNNGASYLWDGNSINDLIIDENE